MSNHVTLTLRAPLDEWIDAESVVPVTFATLTEAEIAALPVWVGRDRRRIGDHFEVKGGRSASIRVVGDVRRARRLGLAMRGGELIIDGDAGSYVGAGMAGGYLDVHGSVGDDAGLSISGGALRIRRNAGDRIGAAAPGASRGATGGEIVVEGSVGSDAAARMRRGLLFVGGDSGNCSARAIIAGTVFVMGQVGQEPATASKRGSLVVGGRIDVPVTYRYACDYEPPHVRLALTSLSRRHGLSIDRRFVEGRYRRYCGDAGTIGKGEILQWSHSEPGAREAGR